MRQVSRVIAGCKEGRRTLRKAGGVKSLVKLAKELVVMLVRGEGQTDQVGIALLTAIIGLFSNYLAASQSKDSDYFILKGGLTLCVKLLTERPRLPHILSLCSDLLINALAVLSLSQPDADTRVKIYLEGIIKGVTQVIRESLEGKLSLECSEYGMLCLMRVAEGSKDAQEELCKAEGFH